jgi:hypothetical protein
MRAPFVLAILGLSLFGSGCTFLCDTTRLVIHKVKESVEDHRERRRDRRWAEDAWELACATNRGQPLSDDYGRGFKDGFAEYLYKGGSGEPPLIPPPQYRALRYQSPRGYLTVQDWFAGYRHGASAARASGFRQLVTGPTSLLSDGGQPCAGQLLGPPPALLGQPVMGDPFRPRVAPAEDFLPPPRKVVPENKSHSEEQSLPDLGAEREVPQPAAERAMGLGQKNEILPCALGPPEEVEEILLPPAPPVAVGSSGVVPATLAAQQVPTAPPRHGGVIIRPLLPGLANYEIHVTPPAWLVGAE